MKIPKVLKVGGHKIDIVFDAPILETTESAHFDRTKNRIVIDKTLTQSQQESSLFHELFHVFNATLDHSLLDSLSEQLYQVLLDNDLLK